MNVDALIFAAHPDDAELSMGGTIAKLSKQNLKVGIIDVTRGELGTRGTAETRQEEAFKAGIILKIAVRENLNIPDGAIGNDETALSKIISSIRKYKPKIIFAPYFVDRHPDHSHLSQLVKDAYFFSGLPKVKTEIKNKKQDAYRPKKLYYFMQTYTFDPTFIVDISDTFEMKMKAVKAFDTQFYDPKSKEPETFISQPGFIKFIESRAQFYGFKIGQQYGEPFYCEEEIELNLAEAIKSLQK